MDASEGVVVDLVEGLGVSMGVEASTGVVLNLGMGGGVGLGVGVGIGSGLFLGVGRCSTLLRSLAILMYAFVVLLP